MQHLRRLMLVHCCIYYRLNDNLVSDHQWYEWSKELADLQSTHGETIGFYDELFRKWEGSSGYHLTYDADVIRVAHRLLQSRPLQKDKQT